MVLDVGSQSPLFGAGSKRENGRKLIDPLTLSGDFRRSWEAARTLRTFHTLLPEIINARRAAGKERIAILIDDHIFTAPGAAPLIFAALKKSACSLKAVGTQAVSGLLNEYEKSRMEQIFRTWFPRPHPGPAIESRTQNAVYLAGYQLLANGIRLISAKSGVHIEEQSAQQGIVLERLLHDQLKTVVMFTSSAQFRGFCTDTHTPLAYRLKQGDLATLQFDVTTIRYLDVQNYVDGGMIHDNPYNGTEVRTLLQYYGAQQKLANVPHAALMMTAALNALPRHPQLDEQMSFSDIDRGGVIHPYKVSADYLLFGPHIPTDF
jgi:hypothetical protein